MSISLCYFPHRVMLWVNSDSIFQSCDSTKSDYRGRSCICTKINTKNSLNSNISAVVFTAVSGNSVLFIDSQKYNVTQYQQILKKNKNPGLNLQLQQVFFTNVLNIKLNAHHVMFNVTINYATTVPKSGCLSKCNLIFLYEDLTKMYMYTTLS